MLSDLPACSLIKPQTCATPQPLLLLKEDPETLRFKLVSTWSTFFWQDLVFVTYVAMLFALEWTDLLILIERPAELTLC